LPGGPSGLPAGVLASPGFFFLPIPAAYVTRSGRGSGFAHIDCAFTNPVVGAPRPVMRTMYSVYARIGATLTAETEGRMREYLGARPRERHGRHDYDFADTGLDVAETRARFATYQERCSSRRMCDRTNSLDAVFEGGSAGTPLPDSCAVNGMEDGMSVAFTRGMAAILAVVPLTLTAVAAPSASADSFIPFKYNVTATTTIKKLNQTVKIPRGTFTGKIDLEKRTLTGDITLPPATFTMSLAGVLPLVTATVQTVETKPVVGKIDFSTSPFKVVATSTFNIHLVSAYAAGIPINLVGDSCTTSKPVSVTMSGTANIGEPATFSGLYTIPPLANCGAATIALNELIPGPGNTFTAHATPPKN
jgi:hypothetical protein